MSSKLKSKQLTQGLFGIYLIALFWIIIFKLNLSLIPLGSRRSINLIPFAASAAINGHIDWAKPRRTCCISRQSATPAAFKNFLPATALLFPLYQKRATRTWPAIRRLGRRRNELWRRCSRSF